MKKSTSQSPTSTFDKPGQRKAPRAPRPRDAATLILVRQQGSEPAVLMGQRHSNHKFMPNKFVFPGGAVDRADGWIAPAKGLRTPVERRLIAGCTEHRARALAMAAIRETFEETGLLVGQKRKGETAPRSASWKPFFDQDVVPRLDILDYVGRAITPPYRDRRFDARFFMADASHIQGDLHDTSAASGELLELHWVPLGDALNLDLPNITRLMISEVEQRLQQGSRKAVPFVYFRNGQPQREHVR